VISAKQTGLLHEALSLLPSPNSLTTSTTPFSSLLPIPSTVPSHLTTQMTPPAPLITTAHELEVLLELGRDYGEVNDVRCANDPLDGRPDCIAPVVNHRIPIPLSTTIERSSTVTTVSHGRN